MVIARCAPLLLLLAAVARADVAAPAPAGRPSMADWQAKQAQDAADAQAEVAKQAKMAAVDKVMSLLESLRSKVLAEGEKEASMYNQFACFCKDTSADKNQAITAGKDRSNVLTTEMNELRSERDRLDTYIQDLTTAIREAEATMAQLKSTRAADQKVYEANAADLSMALKSLEDAIDALKSSKAPTPALIESVKKAAITADALGVSVDSSLVQRAVAFLQQAPEVEMENYKFHSDDIIETLEKLLDNFRQEKTDLDAEEEKSISEFDKAMQNEQDTIELKTTQLGEAKEERQTCVEDIEAHAQELSTVLSTLRDDQEYLASLTDMCNHRARTWDQRSTLRQGEIEVLTQAIGIIGSRVTNTTIANTVRLTQISASVSAARAIASDAHAMEAIEAEAESAPAFVQEVATQRRLRLKTVSKHVPMPSFMQGGSEPGRDAIVNLLKTSGSQLHSTMLSALANQISADPFAKVKQLIQELLERLLAEAANEGNQKGWCDKSIKAAEQKRDYSASAIQSLNSKMAKLEAELGSLFEELQQLEAAINDLNKRRAEAQADRDADHAENMETISTSKTGQEAVEEAIAVLERFYKTSAVATYVSFSQKQTPMEDAPDSGFEGGEQYVGAQGAAGGIISMMNVIKGDFVRTIKETQKAEAQAEKDHMEFMTETSKSLAEKDEAEKQAKKLAGDAASKHDAASDSLDQQSELLATAISELLELKPACIDTGMTYAERVARREEEIAALKKALCVLDNYEQYGPEGAAGDC
eukprot:CAMPEP_0178408162 /NCGR_PEP_ID=MMETSP0689_2-20121128/19797_1 /TAXON_ID=160604 /ORGANISM="Amphidinium massartii, Strain CS-259" /LENGTH=760 /DNA_ID=CAMNT_0020029249 /DNA_START=56 /DNA_END=2338 /DNA_ORIENTATION=-